MKKSTAVSANPEAYVASLAGWRRTSVTSLRAAVRGAAKLSEVVKWGHLVFSANGPVLLIRAEDDRVLLGFWRGQRLRDIEPRLKPGGKYEMATLVLREGETIAPATVRRLAKAAVALNVRWGDPTSIGKTAKPGARSDTEPSENLPTKKLRTKLAGEVEGIRRKARARRSMPAARSH
jgi:hypothetical protein